MPRRMYDFKCKDSHITESFVDVDTKEVQCSVSVTGLLPASSPHDDLSRSDQW
jgi:hypothetical protein